MKKFSTATAILAFAFLPLTSLAAQNDAAALGTTPTKCAFLENAPDQHKVVSGDTLWGISGKFLQHPWCWPQVWGMNREEISNPHWIYPGQIVYFDRVAGRLRLGTPTPSSGSQPGAPGSENRLQPQIRTEYLGSKGAISSISTNIIEPFLSQPLIVQENELKDTPRIVASQEGHVSIGKGDIAYVRGDLKGGTSFQVFRPSTPLKDPETSKVIGYEAVYLGTVKLARAATTADEADKFVVVGVKEEMGVGDRLLPSPPQPLVNYMPHPPSQPVTARIVSVYEGVANAGQNQIVSINKGKNDGIDVGTVLQLHRFGQTIKDRTNSNKLVKLPDEEYGTLFVFRIFDNISYALIMQVRDSVYVGDVAKTPE